MDGLDTDALDAMLPKKVTEAVKSRTKQAESPAPVAENNLMLPRGGKKGGSQGGLSLPFSRVSSRCSAWAVVPPRFLPVSFSQEKDTSCPCRHHP